VPTLRRWCCARIQCCYFTLKGAQCCAVLVVMATTRSCLYLRQALPLCSRRQRLHTIRHRCLDFSPQQRTHCVQTTQFARTLTGSCVRIRLCRPLFKQNARCCVTLAAMTTTGRSGRRLQWHDSRRQAQHWPLGPLQRSGQRRLPPPQWSQHTGLVGLVWDLAIAQGLALGSAEVAGEVVASTAPTRSKRQAGATSI
jgi:hypothetical protein